MRSFYRWIFALLLVFGGNAAFGQLTIERDTDPEVVDIPQKPDQRFANPDLRGLSYSTDAMIAAERRRLRKERNTVQLDWMLSASQAGFSNWSKGGDNTFTGRSTLLFKHVYNRERYNIETRFDAVYGLNVIDTVVFKNEDKFIFTNTFGWKINPKWSYTLTALLQSQFSDGYKSRTNHTLVSGFMSPGTLNIGAGFRFNPPKSPLNINFSPISGNILFVFDQELSDKGTAGIDTGRHVKPTVGPALEVLFDKKFGKKEKVRFRTYFNGFYNYSGAIPPQVRWDNSLMLKLTKVFALSGYCNLIYDKTMVTPNPDQDLQWSYGGGLTITFNYKNK